ncbi:hypothetical protein [Vibrio sp. TRT 29B02]|uniref:hypothetical protein n=1 Tax=Vibrio sp. TRT 29B02 TaxID=3418508 RepID=UPI003CE804AD
MEKLYLLGEPVYLHLEPLGITSFLFGLMAASYYLSRGVLSIRTLFLLFVILTGAAILPDHYLLQTHAGVHDPSAHMAYIGITVASGVFVVKAWVQYFMRMIGRISRRYLSE